ncbi:MAG: hypothetical protein NDI73_00025 [Desulfuromonadales bacterium]|nr:hypothetical protein [Desulfuromonadales bacterium]
MIRYLLAFLLVPALALAHTTACPPSNAPGEPFTEVPSLSIDLQVEAMGFENLDYAFDRRLSSGYTPWTNAAASVLYNNMSPVRLYAVGDYVSTSFYAGSADITTPRPFQITSVGSTYASGCTGHAWNWPIRVASFWRGSNGYLYGVSSYTSAGCSVGQSKYSYTIYAATPVTFTPSCSDGVWNGDETGIDCGGSCGGSCDTGGVLMPQEQLIEFGKMASALVGSFCVLAFALAWGKSS